MTSMFVLVKMKIVLLWLENLCNAVQALKTRKHRKGARFTRDDEQFD